MEGNIAIIISGRELNFEDIGEKIQLKPTSVIKKGELVALKKEAKDNIWIYKNAFNEENYEIIINSFLENLALYSEYIKKYSKEYDVDLNISINSEYAQFGFALSSSNIAAIESLGLNLNLHLLSFGMADDINDN